MDDLEKLIDKIEKNYSKITYKWEQNDKYVHINMKRKKVVDLLVDENLLSIILNYRDFINDISTELESTIHELNVVSEINCRIKTLNSIQFKIENYIENHEDGKISINKCLNDIFGVRIILKEELSFEEIDDFLKKRFNSIKCINSNKGDTYFATHVYFGKSSNSEFQWELQIWGLKNKESNLKSHARYKQEYTNWEKLNRKGE